MAGGGAEHQLVCLCEAMTKQGIEVHVALRKRGPHFDQLKNSGAVVHQLLGSNNYAPQILFQILQLLSKIQPDIVQTWTLNMNVWGGFASMILRIPHIISERSIATATIHPKKWKMWLRTLVGRYSAAVISNSNGGQTYWRHYVPEQHRNLLIRNIVPFRQIEAAQYESIDKKFRERVAEDRKVIVSAGRLIPLKNIDNLLRSMQTIVAKYPDALLLIFGEGILQPELQAMCREACIEEHVRFMGYTREFWNWLQRADLFVMVSVWEGQPNAVLEAIASHCPAVLSDIPAHREFLSDDSAFWVDPHSPQIIADGIIHALSAPDAAQMRAQKAYTKISHLSEEYIVRQHLQAYHSILNSVSQGKEMYDPTT